MECGDYFIEFDKTGFPMISKREWNYFISLFPVCKYQFEVFMVAVGPKGDLYTDAWYRKLLEINPRISWMAWYKKPWEYFITGIRPDEITCFLKYLGEDFSLPEVWQWRSFFQVSHEILNMRLRLKELCRGNAAPPVELWLEKGLFPLFQEGLLEIVMEGGEHQYIGRPWQGLLANTWSPESVRVVNWELCRKAVGFRLMKRKK